MRNPWPDAEVILELGLTLGWYRVTHPVGSLSEYSPHGSEGQKAREDMWDVSMDLVPSDIDSESKGRSLELDLR